MLMETGREDARQFLTTSDPDVCMLAWPSKPWRQMQNINQRKIRNPKGKREECRILLVFVEDIVYYMLERSRAVAAEQPSSAKSCKEPPIQAACTGMCKYPDRHVCTWKTSAR